MKTIVPNPSWGTTLQLLQDKGSIRIDTNSSKTFKNLLDSINMKYTVSDCLDTKLTRFTLIK
jgi:hypothetical protein